MKLLNKQQTQTKQTKQFTAEAYWRLKSAMLESIMREQQLREAAARIVEAKSAALVAAGLDPSKMYTLTDADLTVTVVEKD